MSGNKEIIKLITSFNFQSEYVDAEDLNRSLQNAMNKAVRMGFAGCKVRTRWDGSIEFYGYRPETDNERDSRINHEMYIQKQRELSKQRNDIEAVRKLYYDMNTEQQEEIRKMFKKD